jgi:hypothetical protein
MATKSGALSRIASKAMAAGRVHIGKVLKGEKTLPEAAGGTFENLLSGSRAAWWCRSTGGKAFKHH